MEEGYKPIIGITMGDPSGIGPEIVIRALKSESIYQDCRPFVIGNTEVLERAAREALGEKGLKMAVITKPKEAEYTYGTVNVVQTGEYDCSSLAWGKEQKLAGQIAADAVYKSIEMGMAGDLDAVTTAPINKVAIKMAGVSQAGHTEMYLDGTKAEYVLTMFDCFGMRVFHLSRHISLRNAIDYATKEHVLTDVERIDFQLKKLGITNPKIAVAGINPHCGEGGLFGDEEIRELNPAVESAKKEGIGAVGPIPPDTLFSRGRKGEFDAILAMYHDQGHMPCKTIDLERSVSVTLGLPFLRCSVDHGTAFDIAGKGIATEVSMTTAIETTIKYAKAMREAK